MTTVFPNSGTLSLVLVYAMFMLSTIVAPGLVRWLGAANGVVLGCLGYLGYTLGCLSDNEGLYLAASVGVGLCAGVIWTSQGALLTMLSTTSNRGRHSALIIGSVNAAEVICNLLIGWLLNARLGDGVTPRFSNTAIFLIFLAIGAAGLVTFCALRVRMRTVMTILARKDAHEKHQAALQQQAKALEAAEEEARAALAAAAQAALATRSSSSGSPDSAHSSSGSGAAVAPVLPPPIMDATLSVPLLVVHDPSLVERLVEIFRLLVSPQFRYLFPILVVVQGFSNSFFFGTFGVTMGKSFLGYAQAVMGCVAVPSILGLGRALDAVAAPRHTHRKKWALYLTLSLHVVFAAVAALTTMLSDGYTSHEPQASRPRHLSEPAFAALVYLSCVLFGAAWAGTDVSAKTTMQPCTHAHCAYRFNASSRRAEQELRSSRALTWVSFRSLARSVLFLFCVCVCVCVCVQNV